MSRLKIFAIQTMDHFKIFNKIKVNGGHEDPLYKFLKSSKLELEGLHRSNGILQSF